MFRCQCESTSSLSLTTSTIPRSLSGHFNSNGLFHALRSSAATSAQDRDPSQLEASGEMHGIADHAKEGDGGGGCIANH